MLRRKVGTKYTVQSIRMICGYNGKGCFSLSLTNMPPYIPLRTMRVRARSSPWITSELKKRMHDRDILKIKACKSNDPNDWTQLKKLRNIVNSEISGLAKQAYYQNSSNQYTGDSKKTWQTINELTSRKSGRTAVTSLKVNGVSITNPTELSNEFNNHFATIGPELARNIDSPDGDVYQRYIASTDQCFQLRPTSVNKVFSLLNKLNKSKATGLCNWPLQDSSGNAQISFASLFVIFLTNQFV